MEFVRFQSGYHSLLECLSLQQFLQNQMSNEIEIPNILVEQQQFCLKINQNNFKVFTHVEYLRALVNNIHQMFSQLCKRLIHVTDDYQRKILNSIKIKSEHSQVILDFIKSISLQHFSISNQLNSNAVTLGTKAHRIARNRVQNLKERLLHSNEICKQYLSEINLFNSEEKSFNQKCEYFKDYQKDVLKYYSIKANVEISDKLQIKEMKLKQSQQYIFRRKQDLQAQIHEVRAGLKDYFQLQKSIIAQYSRLLLNIRKVNRQAAPVYAQAIIELSNEPSESRLSNTYRDDPMPTKRSEKPPAEKTATQIRKQIVRDQQRIVILQTYLEEFTNEFQESLKVAAQRIDQIRSSRQYQKFSNDKLIMSEILSVQSIREIDLIINQISLFRTILLNLNTIFGKMKVIREISKYRISNFDKFVQDTQQFIDEQRKNPLSPNLKQSFRKFQNKFIDRNTQLTSRYRERIVELQESVLNQYKREDIAYQEKNKKNFKNDLFQKAYYEMLMSNFFLNRSESVSYRENPYLKKIKMHLSANQVQKTITLEGFSKPIKYKARKNCCGGLFQWGNGQQQGLQVLTEYHCALKDGMMLIQGKMKLYEHHIGFSSHFNVKTLFGYTDIRIPKWDIYQIMPGKHLLSVKITLETTHGNIDFTNFMTMQDPYQKLIELYDTKKNVGSILHKDNQIESQLVQLQQRFQSNFQEQLLKVRITVDTLSTYLSEDKQKLSISIEYHVNGSSCHAMFEIKIIQKTTATDYYFIHDNQSNNNQVKALIQSVSKKLINMKDSELISNVHAPGKDKQLQFSIIEGNEKNKLSFQRQPSFINIKAGQNLLEDINLEEMKISQLQLGPLLTSRVLSGIQTSRNLEPDTKMTTQNKLTQRQQENASDIIPKIELTPKKDQEELAKIPEAESYSVSKSKKVRRNNSSAATHNFFLVGESRREKISHTKVPSSRSKSGSVQKYQGIFYVILILFFLNLILNWVGN